MSAVLDTPLADARPDRRAGGLRELAALALPIILTNLSATLMMTADAAMVGRLGAAELGAVGYGGIWFWTVLSAFSGACSGVQTFVSQAQGAGRERTCGGWAWQGWYAVVPPGVVLIGLFALAFPALLSVLAPAPELRAPAADYVQARAWGVGGNLTAMLLAAFFRGVGDARTPLWAMLAANAVNLVLNYGLIFGELGLPRWEVYGAGTPAAARRR